MAQTRLPSGLTIDPTKARFPLRTQDLIPSDEAPSPTRPRRRPGELVSTDPNYGRGEVVQRRRKPGELVSTDPNYGWSGREGPGQRGVNSAWDRFGTNLWEMLNPVEIAKGLGQAVAHPVETAKAIGMAHGEQLRKAEEAARQGRYSEMIGHTGAALLPVVGPVAANIGEQIGRGDVAGGLGAAAGLLTPIAAAKTIGAVRGVARPSALAQVDMSLAQRMRARGSALAPAVEKGESLVRKLYPAQGSFNRLLVKQQQQVADWANRLTERISPRKPARESGVGTQISLKEALDEATDAMGLEYAAIDRLTDVTHRQQQAVIRGVPQTTKVPSPGGLLDPSGRVVQQAVPVLEDVGFGGVTVPLDSLKNFAVKRLSKLDEAAKYLKTSDIDRMRGELRTIMRAPNRADFQTYQDIRTTLYDMSRSMDLPIGGRSQGLAKQLVKISTEAMQEAADASKIPGLGKRVRDANAKWRQLKETFNESLLKGIRNAQPEQVHRLLAKASANDLDIIKQTLPPKNWDELRARLLADAFDRATQGEITARLGIAEDVAAMSGVVESATPASTFNARQLLRWQENTLGEARLQQLFTGRELKEINALIRQAQHVFGPSGDSFLGFLAQGLNVGMAAGLVFEPLAAGGSIGAFNALGRILVHQTTRSRLLDTLGKTGRRRGARMGALIGPSVAHEGARNRDTSSTSNITPQPFTPQRQ
jgi:hypothetical protein